MRSQTFHLLLRLDSGIFEESLVVGIHRAGIHEVLPNQDTIFVAKREKVVRRINAAAPHTQHIEMSVFGLLQETNRMVNIIPGLNHLLWNIVRAFGKEWHTVHLKIECPPDAVGFIHHLKGFNTRPYFLEIQNLIPVF